MNEKLKRPIFTIGLLGLAVLGFAFLAYGPLGKNLVYYWGPSEVQEAGEKALGASIRLGGLVVPGSIERESDGLTLHFRVTDGKQEVPVVARTVPPAMFREGIGVVLEGTMTTTGHFETRRLMVKHDNEYRAPEEEEDRDMEELMKSLQFDGPET